MAFEAFTNFTQDTNVNNTWTDAGDIEATPREVINVMVAADNQSGTVTDDAEVRVLVARDNTPTNYMDEPILAFRKTPSGVTQEWLFTFSLFGYKHYRVQWRSAGSTDQYTFDGTYRGDGVSA